VLRFINTVTYFQRSGRLGLERALPRAFQRAPERPLHPSPLATRSCVSVFRKWSTKTSWLLWGCERFGSRREEALSRSLLAWRNHSKSVLGCHRNATAGVPCSVAAIFSQLQTFWGEGSRYAVLNDALWLGYLFLKRGELEGRLA
jgi:hypothetical protein